MNKEAVYEGLEGIKVTETRLSHVDGEKGVLVIAGERVESLAGRVSFEEIAERLLETPHAREGLYEGRRLSFEALGAFKDALDVDDAMVALRAGVARLDVRFEDPFLLIGAVGTLLSAHARVRRKEAPLAPRSDLGHAEDLLAMMTGATDPRRARALDAYMVTVSDHSLNASTFTARVVMSTGSDLVSAVTAAIGALKGPLHGGAPGPVLDMLDAIGSAENAEAFLEGKLARKERIMGMGHRIYRVRDPRAFVLERAISELESAGAHGSRLDLARAVEAAARRLLRGRYPDRVLDTNVEFYTAILLSEVGVPRELFAATFAAARTCGWCAHAKEQRAHGRHIRPDARYIGPMPA